MTPDEREKALEAARRVLRDRDVYGPSAIQLAEALLSARASVVEECAKVADQMAADWLSRLGNAPDTTPIRTLNWLANMRSAAVGIAAAIRALNSNK